MNKWLVGLAMMASAVVGTILGHASRENALALTGYELNVNPGSSSNAVTCGWHSTCVSPYSPGYALDWGNSGGGSVYWRSWAFLSDGSGSIGTASLTTASGNCYVIGVDVKSVFGIWKGSTSYTHTTISGSSRNWSIPGAAAIGTYYLYGPVGTTVPTNQEKATCPKDDDGNYFAHLHHTTDGAWERNDSTYGYAPWTGTGFDLTALDNWMGRHSWAE